MSVDITLLLEPIKGESDVTGHWGEIDVLSFSWGMRLNGVYRERDGAGRADVSVGDVVLTKYVDLATAPLHGALATGQKFANGRLSLRKSGKNPLDYLVYDLMGAMVSSIEIASGGGDDRPVETVSLTFEEIRETYRKQANDGSGADKRTLNYRLPDNNAF